MAKEVTLTHLHFGHRFGVDRNNIFGFFSHYFFNFSCDLGLLNSLCLDSLNNRSEHRVS